MVPLWGELLGQNQRTRMVNKIGCYCFVARPSCIISQSFKLGQFARIFTIEGQWTALIISLYTHSMWETICDVKFDLVRGKCCQKSQNDGAFFTTKYPSPNIRTSHEGFRNFANNQYRILLMEDFVVDWCVETISFELLWFHRLKTPISE